MKNISNSVLLSKPIKSLPQNLIYCSPKEPDCYKMINVKGEWVATMHASTKHRVSSNYYKDFLPYDTFHIRSLKVYKKNQGYGTSFAKFAKLESFNKGCNGKTSLVAFNPSKSPHLFWYKQGFRSTKDFENDFFEKCITQKISISHYDAIDMFLPVPKPEKTEPLTKEAPNLEKKPQGFRKKLTNLFKSLF